MSSNTQIRAELDAYYACLYGLTRDELRYTPCGVDPKEVHGEDFPGETFRVLKEKEVRLYGDAPQSDVKAGAGGVGWAGERMRDEYMKDEIFYGEDFTGETIRVLGEKEVRLYGKYRTSRLVLEAWDGQGQ